MAMSTEAERPYLAVCAIYRWATEYLREWIVFHRLQGVERFFMYDNENDDDHELRGTVTISGLNGLRIDNHGTICGHIKAGVTDVTLFHVVVTFTVNGSTATQEILWTVKPAPDRKGRKD